jgi:hypothetical protein
VQIPASGTTLLVRTAIINDTTADNGETLVLRVTNAGGGTVDGTATINDQGGGSKWTFNNANDPGTASTGPGSGFDDDRPLISVSSPTVVEGLDQYAVFTVSLSNASAQTISINPTLLSGSGSGTAALVGTDTAALSALAYSFNGTTWSAVSGTLNIAAGQTSVQLRIAIPNDAPPVFEGAETFQLSTGTISGVVRNTQAALGTATIIDDGSNQGQDDRPLITIANVSVNEDADNFAVFTVSLSNASTQTISFTPALGVTGTTGTGHATLGADTGATAGLEYSFDSATWLGASAGVSLAPGEKTVFLRTAIVGDTLYEGAETFTLTSGAITGITRNSGAVTATATIIDDGSAGGPSDKPTLLVSSPSAGEADDFITFVISLDRLSVQTVSFTPVFTQGTAILGTDTALAATAEYSTNGGSTWSSLSGPVSIAAGQSSITVRLAITNDTISESPETFVLATGSVSGTVANPSGASGTGTITDNDAAPGYSINDLLIDEAAGTASFTVTRSGSTGAAGSVSFATSNGTANSGTDYTATSGTLSFGIGETTKSITVTILNDAIHEGAETFNVTLSNPEAGASLVDATGIGTIRDDGQAGAGSDDDRPTLSISDASGTREGSDQFAVFTVSLSRASTQTVTFVPTLQTTGSGEGHATIGTDTGSNASLVYSISNGANWSPVAGNLSFAAGSQSVLIRTAINDDTPAVFEGAETYRLTSGTITGPVTNTAATSGLGRITDDGSGGGLDDRALAVNSITVNEASTRAFFRVTANAGQLLSLAFGAGTTNRSADGLGADYGAGDATNLEYWNSTANGGLGAWMSGASSFVVPGAGTAAQTILVRTPITNDSTLEIAEDFKLTASYLSGATRSATGTATIRDDGIGTVFNADGSENLSALPDDDRGPPDLIADSDSGRSQTDDITNDNTPTFQIDDLPANMGGVKLFVGGLEVPSTYDPSTDTLTATSPISDGQYAVQYRVADASGIYGRLSPGLTVVIDTLVPVGTSINQIGNTQVAGLSEPDAWITVQVGSRPFSAPGDTSHSGMAWTYLFSPFDISALQAVEATTITVSAEDVAGNRTSTNAEFSKTSLEPPYITEFIPADSREIANRRVEGTPQLNFVFNEWVEVGSGFIRVYRESDNLLVAQIDVTDGLVSIDSPEAVTIEGLRHNDVFVELPGPLVQGVRYYATIDAGAFVDLDGLSFAGQLPIGTPGWDFVVAPAMIVPEFVAEDDVINAQEAMAAVYIDASIEATAAVIRALTASNISLSLYRNTDTSQVQIPATLIDFDNSDTDSDDDFGTIRFKIELDANPSADPNWWLEDTYTYVISISGGSGAANGLVLSYEFDNLVVDLTAPSMGVNITAIDDDAGTVTGNLLNVAQPQRVTDDTAPQIRGVLDAPLTGDARVHLYRIANNGTETRLTNENGLRPGGLNWSFSDAGLLNATTYTYIARVEDAAGNRSATSDQESLTIDTARPAAPLSPPDLISESDSGRSQTDDLTNDVTPTFSILPIPAGESTVELMIGGQVVAATYNPSNNTITANSPLPEGVHEIRYRFRDAAGNAGIASEPLSITIDVTPPSIIVGSSTNTLIYGQTAALSLTVSELVDGLALDDIAAVGGTVSAFTGGGIQFSAVLTPSADTTINGLVSVASTRFTDRAGNPNVDGAEANNTVALNIDTVVPPVSINSFEVNEASPFVVWEVTGVSGYEVSLDLLGTASRAGVDVGSSGADNRVALQWFDPSVGASGQWVDYSPSNLPVIPPSGTLFVRSSIVQDNQRDSGETVILRVSPTGGTPSTGTATISDEGTGLIFTGQVSPTAALIDLNTERDDDRPPSAANDAYTLNRDDSVTISLLPNDTSRTSTPLTLASVNGTPFSALPASDDASFTAAQGYRQLDLEFGTLLIKADGTGHYQHSGRAFMVRPLAGNAGSLQFLGDDNNWVAITQQQQITLHQLEAQRLRYVPAPSELGAPAKTIASFEELDATGDAFTYVTAEGAKLSNVATASFTINDFDDTNFTPVEPPIDADIDGISTQVESVLAARARGTLGLASQSYLIDARAIIERQTGDFLQADPALFGDLNRDGLTDSEQNTVTTFAWINHSNFELGNRDPFTVSTASVVSLVAEESGRSFQSASPLLQLQSIQVLPFTEQQVKALTDRFNFTPGWTPMGFSASLRQTAIDAGITRFDTDPGRAGDQWHFSVDISRTGESTDTFMGFYKWIDSATLSAYSAAGLPLLDLDGKPITSVGWVDFTRRTGNPGGDGVAIGTGTGQALYLDYIITDNRFGDSDLRAGHVTDPGVPIFVNYRADNRPLSISSPEVNEASPHAVFTVRGEPAQRVTLSLVAGSATGGAVDFGNGLQYSVDGGKTWTDYAGGELMLPIDGQILVRTPVVNDLVLDSGETFSLVAQTTGGARFSGTATLRDDGVGTVFRADGSPDPSAKPDDDRPRPPVVVPPPVILPPPVITTPAPVIEAPRAQVPIARFDTAINPTKSSPLALPERQTISDIYTSSSGFRTAVVGDMGNRPALMLFKGVPDQYAETNRSTSFALPPDAFAHTQADAVVRVDARQANGEALPSWVQFNAQSGTFEVRPPAGFTGQLEITVTATDEAGRQAATNFKFSVGQGEIPQPAAPTQAPGPRSELAPAGRTGLSEQLRSASRQGLWANLLRAYAEQQRADDSSTGEMSEFGLDSRWASDAADAGGIPAAGLPIETGGLLDRLSRVSDAHSASAGADLPGQTNDLTAMPVQPAVSPPSVAMGS